MMKKGLEANKRLGKTVRNQVLWTRIGKRIGRPVAWITSGAPVEIVLAAGIIPFYPENHAAICAARSMSESLAISAESQGYSRDLCSYFRVDLGSSITGDTPLGKHTPPDMMVVSNNICGTVQNWFRIMADHYKVPIVFVDTPYSDGQQSLADMAYVKEQLLELGRVCERVSGRRITESRLGDVVDRSKTALDLWRRALHTGASRPATFTSFEAFVHMAPIVSIRGTRRCVSYYRKLLDELEERQTAGIGMVENERLRVVWDNIAIWPAHRELRKMFKDMGVALVADTYTHAWTVEHLDAGAPWESLAKAYTDILLNHGAEHRVNVMDRMIKDFDADGFILHSNRSCKRYSLGQFMVKKDVTKRTGKPGVVIEGDMADPRSVSMDNLRQRLEPFFEQLGDVR